MGKRYTITKEFVFADCLVTPSVYEGVLQRFDAFVSPFLGHLHARTQQQKALAYMKGLLSDTERKNIESIAYFHGEDRQKLQKFIGQSHRHDLGSRPRIGDGRPGRAASLLRRNEPVHQTGPRVPDR